MSKLLCNVLKISGGGNAPNGPPWLRAWRSAEGKQNLSHAGGDHVLIINLCVKFMIPLIFTDIQRKKIRLFNKSEV